MTEITHPKLKALNDWMGIFIERGEFDRLVMKLFKQTGILISSDKYFKFKNFDEFYQRNKCFYENITGVSLLK